MDIKIIQHQIHQFVFSRLALEINWRTLKDAFELYVTSGDMYYLRLILLNRKARSDRDVLTYVPVRGGGEPIVCSSYQQSAIAHGYVDSIQDVTLTYDDMCSNGTASQNLNAEVFLLF